MKMPILFSIFVLMTVSCAPWRGESQAASLLTVDPPERLKAVFFQYQP
jgi:hypothetical protein